MAHALQSKLRIGELIHCCRVGLVGWLVGWLTSSSTTRLYRGIGPKTERLTILRAATHEAELGDQSASHIILTSSQPVGSGRPQRESNPGPPDQESRTLPTELPRPL